MFRRSWQAHTREQYRLLLPTFVIAIGKGTADVFNTISQPNDTAGIKGLKVLQRGRSYRQRTTCGHNPTYVQNRSRDSPALRQLVTGCQSHKQLSDRSTPALGESGCKPVGTTPGVVFCAVVGPDGEVELDVAF
jgi:hypothetical protein